MKRQIVRQITRNRVGGGISMNQTVIILFLPGLVIKKRVLSHFIHRRRKHTFDPCGVVCVKLVSCWGK